MASLVHAQLPHSHIHSHSRAGNTLKVTLVESNGHCWIKKRHDQAMKFLFQCPCCSCFCFMKPKQGKAKVKEAKKEVKETKVEQKVEEKKD
ncbi:hypothetical protein VNO80_26921 [Phaseolus coccineus]|uniref:Uncharacterized protein n=1 Tax=Phaseolus coccineus TaxID=3886 RepID=A0AAN9LFL7_PHACN